MVKPVDRRFFDLVPRSAVVRWTFALALWIGFAAFGAPQDEESRPRARDLGIRPGVYEPGPLNAITDVEGVLVGHATLVEGDAVRTGVTAILPHAGNLFREKVPAAVHVFNAFGKLVGSTQVQELGQLETPILLTNTLAVWDAAAALAEWTLRQPGNERVQSVNPVVGETNDGFLNDIRRRSVTAETVRKALESAAAEHVEEGSVGAGTGTVAFGWKGGIGTSSRIVPLDSRRYLVGVLVQTNFGGQLSIDGVPVWRLLQPEAGESSGKDGSCMIVLATDAPLDARQLGRLAARAVLGLARAGSSGSHGSGDFVVAFSVVNKIPHAPRETTVRSLEVLAESHLSPLFQAAAEATEEAIYNSLLRATTVEGFEGHQARAIPIARLREILKQPR